MAASAKLDTDFEGLVSAKALKKIIHSLKHDLLQLIPTDDGLIIKSGGFTETLQLQEEEQKGYFDLQMWGEGIKWKDSIRDIIGEDE